VISGNSGAGVYINASSPTPIPGASNRVLGGFLGTTKAGNAPLPNATGGYIKDSPGNTLGLSLTPFDGYNLIPGHTKDHVQVEGAKSQENSISDNYIGLGADGTTNVSNGQWGVEFTGGAAQNTVTNTKRIKNNKSDAVRNPLDQATGKPLNKINDPNLIVGNA